MHFHLPRVQSFTGIVEQVRDAMKHLKHEKESEAHQVCRSASILSFPKLNHYAWQIFRQAAGHKPKGVIPQTVNPVSCDLRVTIVGSAAKYLRMRKRYQESSTRAVRASSTAQTVQWPMDLIMPTHTNGQTSDKVLPKLALSRMLHPGLKPSRCPLTL